MSSSMKQISLGDFLSREHGLKSKIISTTTTTYISELDGGYDIDEWCLIDPEKQSNYKINQLTKRVNHLEYTMKQLLTKFNQLEKV